jgi:drug/metabolite transporter (DMT)-like permease
MSAAGFALVLVAAFCHATWNFFVKRINGGPELVWLFSLISLILYAPFMVYVMLSARPVFGPMELVFIAGSTVLHLSYYLLLQKGYQKGDLSLVYPTARATGPVISTAFAVVVLGETMTAQIAFGAAIIIIGVVCLTGGLRKRTGNLGVSLAFGMAVGVLIGSYTVWDAHAVATVAIPPLILEYTSTTCRTLLMTPYGVRRLPQVKAHWRDHRWSVVAIALFSPLAYILVLYALTFTPVVYVAPTREISVVLTVLMGSVLLGEGDLQRRLGWACVILCGVVLLATS